MKYSNAKTKIEKTIIVSSIVDEVRDRSPTGGFVKENAEGQWYEVGDQMAREKVGKSFRDLLNYKSSNGAKLARRKEIQGNEAENLLKCNKAISNKMTQILSQSFQGSTASTMSMLTKANIELLNVIKTAFPTTESLEGKQQESEQHPVAYIEVF